MKKITGPAILAAVFIAHVGFLVATEESYTFSEEDYQLHLAEQSAIAPQQTMVQPVAQIRQAVMFVTDETPKGF